MEIPEDWAWTPVDVECASCGAVNPLHEQPPVLLDTVTGVKWECNHCGAANRLGGRPVLPPADYVLECVQCSATFDPNTVEQAADGSWTCPACSTEQRHVALGEQASSSQTGATA